LPPLRGIKPGLAQYVRPQFQMTRKIKSFVTILWIGLLAGTLDITDNLIFNQLRGITPTMVFRYIASGLIGMKAARAGGVASVVLGVAIHYTIALVWTGVFYAASRTQACDSKPAACFQRFGLWWRDLPVHEFHHPAALWSAASTERDHTCFKDQRCAGPSAFYWVTHLASRAPKFNAGCLFAGTNRLPYR